MPNVRTITSVEMVDSTGTLLYGKQGGASGSIDVPDVRTLSGPGFILSNVLADETAEVVWSSSWPLTSFTKLHFWATADCYLQLVTASGSVTVLVAAEDPFVLSSGTLADDYTTAAVAANPTDESITTLRVWNASGASLTYRALLIG